MDSALFTDRLNALKNAITLDPGTDTDRYEVYANRHNFSGVTRQWSPDTAQRLYAARVAWGERLAGEYVEGAPIPDGTLHDIARAMGPARDCTAAQVDTLVSELRTFFADYPEAISDQD